MLTLQFVILLFIASGIKRSNMDKFSKIAGIVGSLLVAISLLWKFYGFELIQKLGDLLFGILM